MKALTRWQPFVGGSLLEELPRSLDEFFRAGFEDSTLWPKAYREMAAWTPRVNVVETPEAFEIEAEVPGLAAEDIKVSLLGNQLTLEGERRHEEEKKEGEKVLLYERSYGAFRRTLTLPEAIDPEGVTAEAKDGVLKVHVKKSEAARPRQIPVATTEAGNEAGGEGNA